MPSQRLLGVAVVGTGKMGADHVRRLEHIISGARVTAVVDETDVTPWFLDQEVTARTVLKPVLPSLAPEGMSDRS